MLGCWSGTRTTSPRWAGSTNRSPSQRRAVEAAPLDPRIRVEYAMRFHWARRFERAREELLRVIDSDPSVPETYFLLFVVDIELGLTEECVWADQKFRELTGSDAPWRQEVRRGYREGQSMEDRIRAWLSVAVAHRDEVHPVVFAYLLRLCRRERPRLRVARAAVREAGPEPRAPASSPYLGSDPLRSTLRRPAPPHQLPRGVLMLTERRLSRVLASTTTRSSDDS